MAKDALILATMLAFVLAVIISSGALVVQTPVSAGVLTYHSNVCVSAARASGEIILDECHPNVFTRTGANMTRELLGFGGDGAPALETITFINLGNWTSSSAPAVTDTDLSFTYTDSGLTAAEGTYIQDNLYFGNWSVQLTFTSTANNKDVNATGLTNSTTAGADLFAIRNFTKVTLQNNDQINVTWTIWVT